MTNTNYDPIVQIENDLIAEHCLYSPLNNRLSVDDRRFHDWYRFVLSFPAHLVRKYIEEFCQTPASVVLDPFCGTGTTLVEAKLLSFKSIGIEANPFAHFASSTKLQWNIPVESFLECANEIAHDVRAKLIAEGIEDDWIIVQPPFSEKLRTLNSDQLKLLLGNSISLIPLHKALTLLDSIKKFNTESFYSHLLLAFAKIVVFRLSNLKFGPEVGVGKIKQDAPAVSPWLSVVRAMVDDLNTVRKHSWGEANVILGDSREANMLVPSNSVDAVITSPPYPNEKDYTRTTRLESVLLGFINSREELRQFKKTLIRSNTRGVYKGDDDHRWISNHTRIMDIADQIEKRRIELNKTSGFERLYGKVTKLYFGGMAKHLKELQTILKPNAHLAYVVGDQASYLRVMIRTGEILAEIAEGLGYKVERIDLFRTRFATTTGEQLREEVVVLSWPGKRI